MPNTDISSYRKAIYSGTFDPITNGHLDIIKRASNIFDEVIIAVAKSELKKPMFSHEQRVLFAKAATAHLKNVRVVGFDTLLVDLAKDLQINTIMLENMLKLSNLGVVIAPPILGYYSSQQTLEDMENFIIGKWMDLLKIDNKLYKRWK